MSTEIIKVPDIGGGEADVIEVCVKAGDSINEGDSLIVLETDKASMEVPAPKGGVVKSIIIKEGDKASEGLDILELELEGASAPVTSAPAPAAEPVAAAPSPAPVAAPAAASGGEEQVTVPDIGGATGVDVIEVVVKVGQEIAEGDSLIVLETDKASMEVPSPKSGVVKSIAVAEGGKVSEGDLILVLEVAAGPAQPTPIESSSVTAPAAVPAAPAAPVAAPVAGGVEAVKVPDIGGATGVDVIEICVKAGDTIAEGDSLIVLETDKASMEVPAPKGGVVKSVALKEGSKVSEGDLILELEVAGAVAVAAPAPVQAAAPVAPAAPAPAPAAKPAAAPAAATGEAGKNVHAGPAVRALAREFGVDLGKVTPTGPRGRILKEDIQTYVKQELAKPKAAAAPAATMSGSGIPQVPAIDFSQWGEVDIQPMSKIHKVTAFNMSRAWLNVPHVTQFDDADITELETFRKEVKAEAEKAGVKLTPLPFIIKACAIALRNHPKFNASLHADGENIVYKKYVHIGMAVDTPNGLVVPVIRDADKKSVYELSREANELAKKAQEKKLKPAEMQGACFTISSLGGIGGIGFTPIVNTPEVAILGVSRADIKPRWNGKEFEPRTMLPLCLSYDHRAINGGDAGRFLTYMAQLLADVRRMLL
ncbi:dihydrolipoyllysine-residue acetyltransferase [Pokkaliibacter sp. MBI-7]|uniref:dihydrolipoyllysine-residue acetyltransferase n=1 Tax=Pokkaliibacter sp. MBI-7 TaxID=3040600 RepID=UPI0024479BCF|nr:dihydrolipoyllysine-residue acetyltransferase [Pokkaliibacter sp. MBI-7]MDH2431582.1 dihydrolipoyllysine-residue acetyltransferase [Pokkaliibacter sp. MBI-7]